ncbi:GNAT family N-acetyltransferase [Streptomyces niger]|uniref:GNAT family N-acetyltransferase n=1 Tax=Streptomyces niger TaxID=66373 RepID=UPI00069AC5FC|nr:GNAT family N-acetyltransferase [Streptomyces niger]
MDWTTTHDLDTFLTAAGDFLRARPAEHTQLLGVTATLAASGPAAYGDRPPRYGWWPGPDGRTAAAFVWTPSRPPLLSAMPGRAAAALLDVLAAGPEPVGGANGTRAAADAFTAAWERRTGRTARLRTHLTLYRLGEPAPPDPAPRGRARPATAADRDLVMDWWGEFARESGGEPSGHAGVVADRLSYGGLTLWEADGRPAAFASRTRTVAGMVRVGPVYTPPELRRNGYAAGASAAVSRAALAAGAGQVLLFADAANRTSTALYERLGYRPVGDHRRYDFPPAPCGTGDPSRPLSS